MVETLTPRDETARVAALRSYAIFGTGPEKVFDRIVELVARQFAVPIALVSLIDENRQWFKAKFGWQAQETDRNTSICAHTILDDDVLVIPDAATDHRVSASPLVTGAPGVRFYAGAPLRDPQGYALGTLCLTDTEPRSGLSENDRDSLADFAAIVADLIVARASANETPAASHAPIDMDSELASGRIESSRNFLQAVLDQIQDGIIACDANGKLSFFNRATRELHGVEREDLPPEQWASRYNLYAADGTTPLQMKDVPLFRAFSGEFVSNQDVIIAPEGGARRHVVASGNALYDKSGNKLGAVVSMHDVTKERTAQSAMQASEEQFRTAIESSPIGMAIVAPNGRWVKVNDALVNMLGYTTDELLKSDFQSITHPDDLEADLGLVNQMLNREIDHYDMEKRYFRKDGSVVWALLSVALVWNDDGTPMHFISQIQDITQRKEHDTQINNLNVTLEQRAAELEAVNNELTAFTYSVSHDLRAPLRSIAGFSQALAEDYGDQLDGEGLDYIRRVRAATGRMEQLIEDLLKLSRLSQNEPVRRNTDLSKIATDVVNEIRSEEPNRRVSIVIAPALFAFADKDQVRILLDNLLRNAWKYSGPTDQPRIEFGQCESHGEQVFFVRDNGVGFDMAYADKLFKPFQRLHSEGEFQGTGIGLATAARVVRHHSGRIWPEASLGEGATFFFTLSPRSSSEVA